MSIQTLMKRTRKRIVAPALLLVLLSGSVNFAGKASASSGPSQILNLNNWKLTLPTGPSEHPTEIKQPALASFSQAPYFQSNASSSGVVFRAPVNGVTTSGSGYPRSELREMTGSGTSLASWSNNSGTHTMYIDEAITAVPKSKKHVVAGQIHDADDDVIVIRLEYPKLFVDINGQTGPILDPDYKLGKRFTVQFVAGDGKIKIYYNGSKSPVYTLSKSISGSYFKAGAYTQSNCSKESDCSSGNYGEVVIYDLKLNNSSSVILASTDNTNETPSGSGSTSGSNTTPDQNSTTPSTGTVEAGSDFEAESGSVTSPMQIVSDTSASGGKYVVQKTDDGTGNVKYNFNVPSSGDYQLRARVIAKDGSSNSVYYSIDGKSFSTWNFPDNLSAWSWTDGPKVGLSAGAHTLTIKKREKNTKLDTFKINLLSNSSTSSANSGSSGTPSSALATSPFEAESGKTEGDMKIQSDSSASGGKFVESGSSGKIDYTLNVPEKGEYQIAGWVKASNGSSNSFYVSIDGTSSSTWSLEEGDSWMYNVYTGKTFSLSAGTHTLTIKKRESGSKIDRLVLIKK